MSNRRRDKWEIKATALLTEPLFIDSEDGPVASDWNAINTVSSCCCLVGNEDFNSDEDHSSDLVLLDIFTDSEIGHSTRESFLSVPAELGK